MSSREKKTMEIPKLHNIKILNKKYVTNKSTKIRNLINLG